MDDLPYINQLSLMRKGIRRNKAFLRSIWLTAEFQEAHRRFDKLDFAESINRRPDPTMTLERFVPLLDRKGIIKLQLASPDPEDIRYCAITKTNGQETGFAWLEMPYTPRNLSLITSQYHAAFGTPLLEEPQSPSLIDYYRWRIGTGPSPWEQRRNL